MQKRRRRFVTEPLKAERSKIQAVERRSARLPGRCLRRDSAHTDKNAAKLEERNLAEGGIELVDLVGIEPTTSSMPWKRAPKLRHRPTRCGNATSLLSPLRLDFVKPRCLARHRSEEHTSELPP